MSAYIVRLSDAVLVRSPYHPILPRRLREAGGRWDGRERAWRVPRGREERAVQALRLLYGTPGEETVHLWARLSPSDLPGPEVWLAGRQALKAGPGRVRAGLLCAVVEGEFRTEGQALTGQGTVRLLHVPRSVALWVERVLNGRVRTEATGARLGGGSGTCQECGLSVLYLVPTPEDEGYPHLTPVCPRCGGTLEKEVKG